MNLLTLFGLLIVLGLMFWGPRAIMKAFEIPEKIQAIVYVALVVIAVLMVCKFFNIPLPGISTS